MAGALIVAAGLAPEDLAMLDGLRRAHYPPERNRLPAHLTLFHALPPSAEGEVRRQLALHAKAAPPRAAIAGPINLGTGVALRIVSEELEAIRAAIADHFHGSLTAQDAAGWRPHVTIQNKVAPRTAKALVENLARDFSPRPLAIRGLALHRYVDGPWETLGRYPFRF